MAEIVWINFSTSLIVYNSSAIFTMEVEHEGGLPFLFLCFANQIVRWGGEFNTDLYLNADGYHHVTPKCSVIST